MRGHEEEETPQSPDEFGTGLRTHLERSRSGDHDPEPSTEPSAEEALAAEEHALDEEEHALEARRRELAERREQIAAVETTLRVREQRIGEVRARLSEEERRLRAAEAELAPRGKSQKKKEKAAAKRQIRELLRERAERDVERVWGTFELGLTATHPDGSPDVTARIAAAQALLAEAYGPPGGGAAGSERSADELAPLRERRREAGSV